MEKGSHLSLGWLRMGGGTWIVCFPFQKHFGALEPFPSVLLGISGGGERRLHLDYLQMNSKDFAWQCFPGSVLQDRRVLVCRKHKWGLRRKLFGANPLFIARDSSEWQAEAQESCSRPAIASGP